MSFYGSISKYYDQIFPYDSKSADFILREVPALASGGTVLDIGCGTGSLSIDLASRGCRVTAIDFDNGMIAAAEKKAHSGNPLFKQMDMKVVKDHFQHASFDAVVCTGNTLANLISSSEVMDAVQGFSMLLKEQGRLVLQILNYEYIGEKKITSLPPLKTDSFLFERHYSLDASGNILFRADFTGSDGVTFFNEISIYPLMKYEITAMLLRANFSEINFFGDLNGGEFKDDSFSLVCVAEKRSDCH